MPDTPAHWKAVIDADGKLLGFDKSGKGDGVVVPVDCDLIVGKYRWIKQRAAWEPIINEFPRDLPPGRYPDHQIAIALAFRRIGQTIELPAYTKKWLEGFARYPDDMSVDDAEGKA